MKNMLEIRASQFRALPTSVCLQVQQKEKVGKTRFNFFNLSFSLNCFLNIFLLYLLDVHSPICFSEFLFYQCKIVFISVATSRLKICMHFASKHLAMPITKNMYKIFVTHLHEKREEWRRKWRRRRSKEKDCLFTIYIQVDL